MLYDIHTGDDLYGRLAMLQPGDEVVVHAGTYPTPGFLELTWAGTAGSPIVIHAAPGEHVVLQGDPSQNVINILGSYFTLQGFEIVGGSHGLRLKQVDHATIQDNVLHNLGDVGISCNFEPMSCDSVQIIHNEIYDTGHSGTGEGMYLGCNAAACLFTNGLVADNYIHDTGGSQGDGIEVKEGAHDNVIRDNVIIRTPYPGITMYGFGGTGGPNIVERNVVWHTQDNGIQIVGQIIVRNNLVFDAAASGIASKPSQTYTPHDVTIVNNTVVGTAICLKSNNWSTETGQVVANNAAYCAGGTAIDINGGAGTGAVFANNIGLGTSNAPSGFTLGVSAPADLGDPATGNVYPPAGSALLGAGTAMYQPADDFNGTHRLGTDVGAYQRTTDTNPGWAVMEGFKTLPATTPDAPYGSEWGPCDGTCSKPESGCGCHGSDPTSLLVALTWLSGRWSRSRWRNRRRRTSHPAR